MIRLIKRWKQWKKQLVKLRWNRSPVPGRVDWKSYPGWLKHSIAQRWRLAHCQAEPSRAGAPSLSAPLLRLENYKNPQNRYEIGPWDLAAKDNSFSPLLSLERLAPAANANILRQAWDDRLVLKFNENSPLTQTIQQWINISRGTWMERLGKFGYGDPGESQ